MHPIPGCVVERVLARSVPERYATCLFLIGRKAEARSFVEEFLPKQTDYFEGFATPFLKMLDAETS